RTVPDPIAPLLSRRLVRLLLLRHHLDGLREVLPVTDFVGGLHPSPLLDVGEGPPLAQDPDLRAVRDLHRRPHQPEKPARDPDGPPDRIHLAHRPLALLPLGHLRRRRRWRRPRSRHRPLGSRRRRLGGSYAYHRQPHQQGHTERYRPSHVHSAPSAPHPPTIQ